MNTTHNTSVTETFVTTNAAGEVTHLYGIPVAKKWGCGPARGLFEMVRCYAEGAVILAVRAIRGDKA
jgi:hypothetical protein